MAAFEPSTGPEPLYAYLRLAVSLVLMTTGSVGMYATVVVMKPIAAEFGSTRSAAAIAYAVTMIGFGIGGIAWIKRSNLTCQIIISECFQRVFCFFASIGQNLGEV